MYLVSNLAKCLSCVPNIRRNLLSVSQIEMKDKRLIFDNGKVKIFNKKARMMREAFNKDGLLK